MPTIMQRVKSVKAEKGYRLLVKLSNGKEGYFDASLYLDKGIFKQLQDFKYFK